MAVIYSVQILVFKLVKLAAKYNISEIQKASLNKYPRIYSLCFSSRNNERGMWKSHGNHWLMCAKTQVSIKQKTFWGHVLLATTMILHMYLGLMMSGTLLGCSICYLYNRAGCIGIDSVLLLISSNIKQSKQKVSFHEVWCQ